MQIIDGYVGVPNIYADVIGEHNISMYGSGDYVLNVGECLGYELISNNEIRIKDGMFITQGRRGYIKKGTTEVCQIDNGAQTGKRNDLIVIEYAKDLSTQVESHTIRVLKGIPGAEASDPEITTGSIPDGAILHQMPLYRVKIEGLSVAAIEQLFEIGSVAAETVDPMLATESGYAADAKLTGDALKEQQSNLTASNNVPFRFAVNENGEYGHMVADSEGADTFVPFSGKYRKQIIGALQNTNLELTEDSTWQEIIDGIYSLFPEMLDVLAYLGISSLSISGSSRSGAGKWHYKSSGKFDITHFNTLNYVLSLDTSGGSANCVLYYEGGSMSLSAGSKTVDVSKCTGEAYFQVGQSQVYHSEGDYTSGGEAYLTTAKVYV